MTENPAGLPALRWRVSPHATALQRMRDDLGAGAPGRPPALRTLAHHPPDDPALALLDSWAVVADIVSFYTERIAQEGFLRTATERLSVRELARTLGYELRPGVAASVELAFESETASGAPEQVLVPASTPVQSIPGQGELPQTFETSAELTVRGGWNRLPARASLPQFYGRSTRAVWVTGTTTPARPGDHLLVVGQERIGDPEHFSEVWDFRTVQAVAVEPDGRKGWIRLDLDRPLGHTDARPLISGEGPEVHLFTDRTRLFGHNAPEPSMLVTEAGPPPGSEAASGRRAPPDGTTAVRHVWSDYALHGRRSLELDGDHPAVLPGTWIVLEQPEAVEALLVRTVTADGLAQWGLSGPVTRTLVDLGEDLSRFSRRRAKVHCGSVRLPAAEVPRTTSLTGDQLEVVATDPPLPVNRLVLVTGSDAATGEPRSEPRTVMACEVLPDTGWMRLTFDRPLSWPLRPETTLVRGNVVAATHGETVHQVLGSGTAAPFTEFRPRRGPLTYVRAPVPDGASAELEVRVDGVAWHELPGLDTATPAERAYLLRHQEDGTVRLIFGDGVHGARVPTGAENVQASYRVGIGEPGDVDPGQVSLLARRPLGVREVTNPGAAHDWAPPETLETARINAPLRIRTLDRAVSVADHADFARGFAGVGPARGDLVWNGQSSVVLVSILGVNGVNPSSALVEDVASALQAARDPGQPAEVRAAEVLDFALSVDVAHHPDHRREDVLAAVSAALVVRFGRSGQSLTAPVSAAEALAVIRSAPGVRACTMPVLESLAVPVGGRRAPRSRLRARPAGRMVVIPRPAPGGATRRDRLLAAPGRYEPGRGLLPAQLWALRTGDLSIGEMSL